MSLPRILFVCVENANRSQLAAAFARLHGGGRVMAESAGSRPAAAINPRAAKLLAGRGIEVGSLRPRALDAVGAGPWQAVITMGCGDQCPWLDAGIREDWALPDPREMPEAEYLAVADEIERRVCLLLQRLASCLTMDAATALQRLKDGNQRFVANVRSSAPINCAVRRADQIEAQRPFAIVLGCSDSRVPVEIVFDQGLGDLFVIRVAGNIVAPSLVGSVEFAAAQFGSPLVIVLGHTSCGAVAATLDEMRRPTEIQSPNLRSIVDRIRPAIAGVLAQGGHADAEALAGAAVRANILASVEQLQHGSDIIEGLVSAGELTIVGAEYSLETGVVEFLD